MIDPVEKEKVTSPYDSLYRKADEYIVFNEDDDDKKLKAIRWKFPNKAPSFQDTVGYGQHPENQCWQASPMPQKLMELHKRKDLSRDEKVKHIEDNFYLFEEEIEYIKTEWYRVVNGVWIFILGKQYYLPGVYYFYLQWWKPEQKNMQFRMRDLKFFLFWMMCKLDPLCAGFNYPKHRREGATTKVSCIRYYEAMLEFQAICAIQSKEEKHAQEVHLKHIVRPWKQLPFWFCPIWDENRMNQNSINFESPSAIRSKNNGKTANESSIVTGSSNEKEFDGYKIKFMHNDEVGKTVKVDVKKRYEVQRSALFLPDEGRIYGKCINTSTVDEMEKGGGKVFYKLCKQSMYHDRVEGTGKTRSWLYTLFIPAWDGIKVDKYGFSNREENVKEFKAQRKAYKDANEIESLIEYTRQYPLRYADCWKISAADCQFNLANIEERLEELLPDNPHTSRGYLRWKNGERDTKVEWVDDPNSRFVRSFKFGSESGGANNVKMRNGRRYPGNEFRFVAGGDTFKHDTNGKKGEGGTEVKERSDGGGTVYRRKTKGDRFEEDNSKREGDRFAMTYLYRPPTKDEFGEDMIMMCVYFGCKINQEYNFSFLRDYFVLRGYGAFLYYFIKDDGSISEKPGITTSKDSKDEIWGCFERHIEYNCSRECHDEILDDCKEIEDDMGPYDRFAAGGMALLADANMREHFDDEFMDRDLEESDLIELDTCLETFSLN